MKTKILCIDDDPMFGVLVNYLFKTIDTDIEVISKNSSSDGLTYLRSIDLYDLPHIILLDINMNTQGGFQFLEAYKNHGFNLSEVSIFMVSSTLFPEDQRNARSEPLIKGVFTKPFNKQSAENVLKLAFSSY
jgi:CheY-like chemotaxis protein